MAFREPDQTLDEAVAAMFERARNNEKSPPRKHHVIPASYLSRWQRDGQIRVTETDSKHAYTPSTEKAARETDFYSLASEDLDHHKIPPLLMETILSQIEGSAKPTIDLPLDSGPTALSPLDALGFAQFLAFQVTRGRACRAQIMAMAKAGMLKLREGISDDGIAARLKQQGGDHSPGGRRWHPGDVGRVDGREVDDGSAAGRPRRVCRPGTRVAERTPFEPLPGCPRMTRFSGELLREGLLGYGRLGWVGGVAI